MAAAFTVFSLAVTAWWRVQSGSEWCPDGLETLTARQTSPATPQLCTLGELWSHPGDVWILPEALQHCGLGWYPLHVHTTETRGLWPRGAHEPGEQEPLQSDRSWWLQEITSAPDLEITQFISLKTCLFRLPRSSCLSFCRATVRSQSFLTPQSHQHHQVEADPQAHR